MSSTLFLLFACMLWWWLGDSLCYRQTTSQHNCETVQNFTIERLSHFMLLCSQQRYVGQSNTCAEDDQVVAEYIKLTQVSPTPIYWTQFLEPCLVMYTTGVLLVVIAHVQSDAVSVCQSPEEKGPVLVIHQPLFHVSPLAKDQLSAEALSKCKGAVHTYLY